MGLENRALDAYRHLSYFLNSRMLLRPRHLSWHRSVSCRRGPVCRKSLPSHTLLDISLPAAETHLPSIDSKLSIISLEQCYIVFDYPERIFTALLQFFQLLPPHHEDLTEIFGIWSIFMLTFVFSSISGPPDRISDCACIYYLLLFSANDFRLYFAFYPVWLVSSHISHAGTCRHSPFHYNISVKICVYKNFVPQRCFNGRKYDVLTRHNSQHCLPDNVSPMALLPAIFEFIMTHEPLPKFSCP